MPTFILGQFRYLAKVVTQLKEGLGLLLRVMFNVILTCYHYAGSNFLQLVILKIVCRKELMIISDKGRNLTM